MKEKLFILAFLTTLTGFSQTTIKRTELSNSELEYLARDLSSLMRPKAEDFEKSSKNQLITYEYEIHYQENVIFRGAIKKPSLSDIGYGMNRRNATFCLEYDQFDSDTKLEIAESRNLYLSEDENGKKWFWADHYKLFEIKNRVLNVRDKIAENLTIRFFKNEY